MKDEKTTPAKCIDYATTQTPEDYKCANCGASGCKLWREYQTFDPQLLCASCACEDQNKTNNVDEEGMRPFEHGVKTDQIGWYVPAVPDEAGLGYWGYPSVPDAGVKWWKRLPLLPPPTSK